MRMSKRAGTVITLDDLVDAIGVDAARYAPTRSSVDSPIDIDLQLWSSASSETRFTTCNTPTPGCPHWPGTPPSWACRPISSTWICWRTIRRVDQEPWRFSGVLKAAASLREPHRVCRYL